MYALIAVFCAVGLQNGFFGEKACRCPAGSRKQNQGGFRVGKRLLQCGAGIISSLSVCPSRGNCISRSQGCGVCGHCLGSGQEAGC